MKFKLVDVGRSKATREVDLDQKRVVVSIRDRGRVVETALLREVRKHLMSRDVGISFTADGKTGMVVVGGCRPVGDIECLDEEAIAWARDPSMKRFAVGI